MPTLDGRIRVFLCHASQDKPIVYEVYLRLLAKDWVDPWLDEEKLLPGQDWGLEIEKAVEAADAVIVFLSNESVTKEGYIQRELKFVIDLALERPDDTIFVIPLRLDDCPIPRRLRSWHYVDYFPEAQKEKALDRIFGSLGMRGESLGLFKGDIDQMIQEEKTKREFNERELEILHLFASGYSDREIQSKMNLTANAVKTLTRSLLNKMDVLTRSQLLESARRRKLIP